MLAQVHFPHSLTSTELDQYLANGWFRMGQTIFTSNFLNFNDRFYSAVWLRIRLKDFIADRSYEKLLRANSKFSVNIREAEITPEKEELFFKYRSAVSFEASTSLTQLLLGTFTKNVFNTFEISIRDDGKLIACGIFDIGGNSAAGISSFYDPQYKKFSLGKFIIHSKVRYCYDRGLTYFYPGYFVPGYSRFDYKLKIQSNALEYYRLADSRWTSIEKFNDDVPLARMAEKLDELARACTSMKVDGAVYYYDYFDANLVHSLSHLELFDFPMFYATPADVGVIFPAIVCFDVRDSKYHVMTVESMWTTGADHVVDNHYSVHLLKTTSVVFSSPDPMEVANALHSYAGVTD